MGHIYLYKTEYGYQIIRSNDLLTEGKGLNLVVILQLFWEKKDSKGNNFVVQFFHLFL